MAFARTALLQPRSGLALPWKRPVQVQLCATRLPQWGSRRHAQQPWRHKFELAGRQPLVRLRQLGASNVGDEAMSPEGTPTGQTASAGHEQAVETQSPGLNVRGAVVPGATPGSVAAAAAGVEGSSHKAAAGGAAGGAPGADPGAGATELGKNPFVVLATVMVLAVAELLRLLIWMPLRYLVLTPSQWLLNKVGLSPSILLRLGLEVLVLLNGK